MHGSAVDLSVTRAQCPYGSSSTCLVSRMKKNVNTAAKNSCEFPRNKPCCLKPLRSGDCYCRTEGGVRASCSALWSFFNSIKFYFIFAVLGFELRAYP
jgi:hypothetical protein